MAGYETLRTMKGGWFDKTIAEMRRRFPDIPMAKLVEFGGQCGIHPPCHPESCGYQGSLSPKDFRKLVILCEEERDK